MSVSRSRVRKIERRVGQYPRSIRLGQLLPFPELVEYLNSLSESDRDRVEQGLEPEDGSGMREWFQRRGYSFEKGYWDPHPTECGGNCD